MDSFELFEFLEVFMRIKRRLHFWLLYHWFLNAEEAELLIEDGHQSELAFHILGIFIRVYDVVFNPNIRDGVALLYETMKTNQSWNQAQGASAYHPNTQNMLQDILENVELVYNLYCDELSASVEHQCGHAILQIKQELGIENDIND